MFREKNESLIISYVALRRWIGILGILLPFICLLGGWLFAGLSTQQSISSYYYTNMRDFFVGLLIGVSLFLLTYRGYERIDSIVARLSGIAGFCVAVFPCLYESSPVQPVGIFQVIPATSNTIHLVSACLFFILLGCNSFFLFTMRQSKDAPITKSKGIRNSIYRSCGLIIFACIALLLVFLLVWGPEEMHWTKAVLFFETIMLCAFGFSWLVKGETLFRDKAGELPVKQAQA
jgi:hypothetical protein